MYTEPKIINSNDLTKRSYITFYINEERIREYNGNTIGQRINPNRASNLQEREALLRKLQFEIHKALDAGTYRQPIKIVVKQDQISIGNDNQSSQNELGAEELLTTALKRKVTSKLARKYKRNLTDVHKDFIGFLTPEEAKGCLTSISSSRIDEFLSRYTTSGTYYMNKRRDLGVLFNAAAKQINITVSIIKNSERRRCKAKLHKAYEQEQLKPLLDYLKSHAPNLHLCCLLTYGAWLRPHEEVRLLRVSNFTKDNSQIQLSGSANKGGKVRVVYVPNYIQGELSGLLLQLSPLDNIFSSCDQPFNPDYFKTQWRRIAPSLIELGLITDDQTIYSFRHTAAIQLYRRTKDVYLLQKLLGHSTIIVTLKYLRSLGEVSFEELIEYAPTL
jgi:integrase